MKKDTVAIYTGILGAENGCGTTLLALALANCSVSRLRRKTALIEIGKKELCQMLTDDFEYQEGIYHFSILGIDIYSSATLNDIGKIKRDSYDEIIIDFGHTNTVSHEYRVCDRQIITASFLPYRHKNLNKFLGDTCDVLQVSRAEVVAYGKNKTSQQWEKSNHKHIFYMPTIFDPLRIPIKDANHLIKLLED